MGIADLNEVLRKNAPGAFEDVNFEYLRGTVCAVDISIFFNVLVKSRGETEWRGGFVDFLTTFKKFGIVPEFVFDGPEMPEEKQATQQARRESSQKAKDLLAEARDLRPSLLKKQARLESLTDDEIANIIRCIGPRRAKNLDIDFSDIVDVVTKVDKAIAKMTTQTSSILASYSSEAKDLIQGFGFSFFEAQGEAEGLCVSLVLQGVCDLVMTSDTDVLAYGVPLMISKFNLATQTATMVVLETALEELGLSYHSFRDMCIMLGCDYNTRPRLPGKSGSYEPSPPGGEKQFGTGPVKAYQLIKEYGNLEAMRDLFVIGDYERMKVERCREIFTPPSIKGIPFPKIREIDLEYLAALFKKYKISRSLGAIAKIWEPPKLEEVGEEVYEDPE